MKETERLATELECSLEGGAWHGPALLELLAAVTPDAAAKHPIAGWHSIWELVNHVVIWQDIGRRRLGGDAAQVEIGGIEDWPVPKDASAAGWAAAIQALRASNEALAAAIRAMPETRLDQPILENMSTAYHTLHGVVQHNLYHAGQIVALKRAIGLPAVDPSVSG